jgi:flavodoxin
MAKTIVICYSRRGQNYVNGSMADLEKGNAELIAGYIQKAVGADVFMIETVEPYPEDYMECTEVAKQEQRDNARPKLKAYLHDIKEYDNIVIAGPCWWGTYPCAVFAQLEKLHFRGKHVFPVMTHEGSGEANSRSDLKKFCTGAKVEKAFAIRGSSVPDMADKVAAWAQKHLD